MIEEVQPDIVAIPTATELHYELSMRVLEHGVNIEVEKPMCIDLEQADAVIAKAQAQGVKVAVHQQSRAGPNMQATFRAFQEGRIGGCATSPAAARATTAATADGLGTHMLNNMLQFGERCRSVSAVALTDGRLITPDDVHTRPLAWAHHRGEYHRHPFSSATMSPAHSSSTVSPSCNSKPIRWSCTAPKVAYSSTPPGAKPAAPGGCRRRITSRWHKQPLGAAGPDLPRAVRPGE